MSGQKEIFKAFNKLVYTLEGEIELLQEFLIDEENLEQKNRLRKGIRDIRSNIKSLNNFSYNSKRAINISLED